MNTLSSQQQAYSTLNAIELDRDRALQDPRAKVDQILIATNRRMSEALRAHRNALAQFEEAR
jgi:hypothetical protein